MILVNVQRSPCLNIMDKRRLVDSDALVSQAILLMQDIFTLAVARAMLKKIFKKWNTTGHTSRIKAKSHSKLPWFIRIALHHSILTVLTQPITSFNKEAMSHWNFPPCHHIFSLHHLGTSFSHLQVEYLRQPAGMHKLVIKLNPKYRLPQKQPLFDLCVLPHVLAIELNHKHRPSNKQPTFVLWVLPQLGSSSLHHRPSNKQTTFILWVLPQPGSSSLHHLLYTAGLLVGRILA